MFSNIYINSNSNYYYYLNHLTYYILLDSNKIVILVISVLKSIKWIVTLNMIIFLIQFLHINFKTGLNSFH